MDAMTFDGPRTAIPGTLAAMVDGWRLWRRRFWMLSLLSLSPIFVEVVVQPIPVVGMITSKVIAFLLLGVVTLGLDQVANEGRIDLRHLATTLRAKAATWAAVAMIGMVVVFGSQVIAGRLLAGPHAWEWLLLGDMKTHPPQDPLLLLSIIPFGTVAATLLMLAMPLALLRGLPAREAVVRSVRIVMRNWRFFLCYMLLAAALLSVAIATLVGMLVVVPWLSASGYAIYRIHAARNSGELTA